MPTLVDILNLVCERPEVKQKLSNLNLGDTLNPDITQELKDLSEKIDLHFLGTSAASRLGFYSASVADYTRGALDSTSRRARMKDQSYFYHEGFNSGVDLAILSKPATPVGEGYKRSVRQLRVLMPEIEKELMLLKEANADPYGFSIDQLNQPYQNPRVGNIRDLLHQMHPSSSSSPLSVFNPSFIDEAEKAEPTQYNMAAIGIACLVQGKTEEAKRYFSRAFNLSPPKDVLSPWNALNYLAQETTIELNNIMQPIRARINLAREFNAGAPYK